MSSAVLWWRMVTALSDLQAIGKVHTLFDFTREVPNKNNPCLLSSVRITCGYNITSWEQLWQPVMLAGPPGGQAGSPQTLAHIGVM